MVIRNHTAYPTDEVRKLVKFGIGRYSAKDVLVNVVPTRAGKSFSGWAYPGIKDRKAPPSCRYEITLRIGTEEEIAAYSGEVPHSSPLLERE